MKTLINTANALVSCDTSIAEAITLLVATGSHCALIYDSNSDIIGIVTGRDILRNLPAKTVDGFVQKKIATIMSTPLFFARLSSLQADISDLNKLKFKH